MTEDKGFKVHDRRRVKLDDDEVETERDVPENTHESEQTATASQTEAEGDSERPPLPPVDFSGFVLGLAQMALMHLGEIPELMTGSVSKDLEQARHTIDILDMLESKTKGNLSEQEEDLLKHLRSELKLKYVRER